MSYPPHPQPQGNVPRRRGPIIWAIVCLAVALAVAVIVVIVLLTKTDATSTTPESGPGIATPGTQVPQGTQAPLADVYIGTSMNHTAKQFGMDGSARLKLQFTEKDPNALAGEIEVDGRDVGGTGLFEGTMNGNRIILNISPQDGAPPFQLIGTLKSDESIAGSLTVPLGELSQSGEWQVQPQR